MIKKTLLAFCLCISFSMAFSQTEWPFKNEAFDTSYKIIAITSKGTKIDGNAPYNFYVSNPAEIGAMKKTWKLNQRHPVQSLYDSTVNIYVVKGKELKSIPLVIYTEQKVANYKNGVYDFDMEKLLATARKHPLKCHYTTFTFETYFEFVFFEDSIQTDPNFLFLFRPTKSAFPGYYDLFVKKDDTSSPEVNAQEAVNKEIQKRYPKEVYQAIVYVRDTLSEIKPGEVRIRVECSENLYKKYNPENSRKSPWSVFPIVSRVYFKD